MCSGIYKTEIAYKLAVAQKKTAPKFLPEQR